MNKKFIHIEGMDLAGKTTVAKKIAELSNMEWKINNNSLVNENSIKQFAVQLGKDEMYDDEIYGYLYFVALLADIKDFELNDNVIQDSTLLLRSINYHQNQGNDELVNLFEGLVGRHPIPDTSIYLTASIEARQNRLIERMENNPESITKNDTLVFSNPEKFMEMDNKLMDLSQKYFNSIVIDNSDMTEEETAEYIINLCELNEKLEDELE